MASATTERLGSLPARPRPLWKEAAASVLLCGTAIIVARLLGDFDSRDRVVATLLGAVVLATVAVATSMVTSGGRTVLAPYALAHVHDRRSQDDVVRLILAQFAGAAVAGCIVGFLWPSMTAIPELWSAAPGRELLATCALTWTASATREPHSAFKIALVVAVASAAGCRFVGSPAIVLGSAFADVTRGVISPIGAVLAAQTLGALLSVVLLGFFDDGPTAADTSP